MDTAVLERPPVRIGDSEALRSFKQGVDSLLERRRYFISQVLPKLIENQDYYVIKGRKVLAKGGAEKLAGIYSLTASFRRDNETMEAFDSIPGLVAYVCDLSRGGDGVILGQGRGASTLNENGKDANKTIKMATKSAYIDAVIRSTGLSDIFTQDIQGSPVLPESAPTDRDQEERRDKMITDRQRELLTQLIYQNIHDSNRAEKWIASLDDLSRTEASEQISSFIGVR